MKALVGAGGGPKGAWSAGALAAAGELGMLKGVKLGIGNSVSAINVPYLCQEEFSPRAFQTLRLLWSKVVDDDVFKSWMVPYVPALWKGGLNSITPLGKFLKHYISHDRALQSRVLGLASALNLHTGKMEFGISRGADFIKWIMASSAHPLWFEPVEIEGQWYTDGGVTDVTPVKEAIRRGATDIIVVAHSPSDDPERWGEESYHDARGRTMYRRPGIIARTMREFNLAMNARLEDDIKAVDWVNQAVLAGADGADGKRFINMTVLRPPAALDVAMPHFRPDDSKRLFDAGYTHVLKRFGPGGVA